MEEELARKVIPPERAVMMRQVSKTVRTAIGRVKPAVIIKVKQNQGMERVEEGMREMVRWARITVIDLDGCKIEGEGAGRLAAVLGQCPSLAHLDLGFNSIGDEGAGRLAVALGQCLSLAHLDLGGNSIGAEGAGRLDAVAEQCPSLDIIR